MTSMKPEIIFDLPDVNDEQSIAAHRKAVLCFFADLFQDIDDALSEALPKVLATFGLYEGPVDLAVHAPNTRYLVRQVLANKSQVTHDEEEILFDMLRVSNCGLCVKTAYGEVRVLKSPSNGLPKALSEARVRFSANNQMVFSFVKDVYKKSRHLNVFVLWKMDTEYKYSGLEIACPRRTRENGEIECYWIAKWPGRNRLTLLEPVRTPAADLDEITALPPDNEKFKG